jgi:hypothetical protein
MIDRVGAPGRHPRLKARLAPSAGRPVNRRDPRGIIG